MPFYILNLVTDGKAGCPTEEEEDARLTRLEKLEMTCDEMAKLA